MSREDTWDEKEEAASRISDAVKAGNTAIALDRMNDFHKKYGHSYSQYRDDQENEYWAKTDR